VFWKASLGAAHVKAWMGMFVRESVEYDGAAYRGRG